MLHEASTVAKAIEKAWTDSGKPLEFSINILEVGEKNFLGLSKHPAIVSITYDPTKRQAKTSDKRLTDRREVIQKKPMPSPVRLGSRDMREIRKDLPEKGRLGSLPLRQRQPFQATQQLTRDEEIWSTELVNDIKGWFKEIIDLVGIQITYDVKVDRRMLQINFAQGLFSGAEEDRQFFVGLSYLLIQFLKKKHKKRLHGYHLVIRAKDYASNEQNKGPSLK